MGIFNFVLGIVLFVSLVLIHEWGHFKAARRARVEVEEFGLGFPPRAKVLTKKNGTEYTLNWLPLGGFVKLKGEHDSDTTKGSFGAASIKHKIIIMLAGVSMNLITALVLFTIVAWIGMPKLLDNQFTVDSDTKIVRSEVVLSIVDDESPASKAGLKNNDAVKSISGVTTDTQEQLTLYIDESTELGVVTKRFAGQTVQIEYSRDNSLQVATAMLLSDDEVTASKETATPKGYLGVVPSDYVVRRSTWSAPIVAFGVTKDFTVATLKGLGSALKGLGSIVAGTVTGNSSARKSGQEVAGSQVAGPVGVFQIMYRVAHEGIGLLLFIIAVISLTLAIMNFLPIPALDGGRLFVTLLFRAIKKPLTPKLEETIHGTGFVVLMALFLLLTIVDIKRL